MNAVNPGDPNAPRFNAGSGFTYLDEWGKKLFRNWNDPYLGERLNSFRYIWDRNEIK